MDTQGSKYQQYYTSIYQKNLAYRTRTEALDECLHHFLDQRPASKKPSAFDRAAGLAESSFWRDIHAVDESSLASLALSKVLAFDKAITLDLLVHLATHNTETIRWAIRYSKLFERQDSPLWVELRSRLLRPDWKEFFEVCDRLLAQLEPFDELIHAAEKQLKSLFLLELFFYLSVLAYEQFTKQESADSSNDHLTLFPEGFSATRFVEVIKSGEIWRGCC